jgi:hypothetical protein
MIDLALDATGAVIAAVVGQLYMRHSSRSRRRLTATLSSAGFALALVMAACGRACI